MTGFGKPKLFTRFEVTSFSYCVNIERNLQILGSFPTPRPRPLFLWVCFYDGLWQTQDMYPFMLLKNRIKQVSWRQYIVNVTEHILNVCMKLDVTGDCCEKFRGASWLAGAADLFMERLRATHSANRYRSGVVLPWRQHTSTATLRLWDKRASQNSATANHRPQVISSSRRLQYLRNARVISSSSSSSIIALRSMINKTLDMSRMAAQQGIWMHQ